MRHPLFLLVELAHLHAFLVIKAAMLVSMDFVLAVEDLLVLQAKFVALEIVSQVLAVEDLLV